MGESRTVSSARLVAVITAGLAATTLLASCAGMGGGASGETSAPASSAASAAPEASAASSSAAATPDAGTPSPVTTEPLVVATPASDASAAPGKAAVVPFITSATWDEARGKLDVSAIVPKVVEPSGTCTLIAVKGDATAKATGPAAPTASYTGCSQLAIARADLTSGTWQVRVSYSSDESAGTSAARTVTVG